VTEKHLSVRGNYASRRNITLSILYMHFTLAHNSCISNPYSCISNPYSKALASVIPVPETGAARERTLLRGEAPSASKNPRWLRVSSPLPPLPPTR
jgi:hypothetical protein